MAEQSHGGGEYEHRDVELEAVGDKFRVMAETLGFVEDGEVGEARSALVREAAQGFDDDNPRHQELIVAYKTAAEAKLGATPEPDAEIGYMLAQLHLWLELDHPDRFYEVLSPQDDRGLYAILEITPGYGDTVRALDAVLDELDALKREK